MTDQVEALERLAKLKANGVLTEEEFAAQKAKLLTTGDDVAAQPEPTVGDRWAEAREKSRGVRRFFHWFFGINALIVILVGTYFLTRLGTVETARQQANQAATSAPAPVENEASPVVPAETQPDTAPAPEDEQATFVATADMLDRPFVWDDSQHAMVPDHQPDSQSLCAKASATIGNSARRPIKLNMVSSEGGDPVSLGTVGVGKLLTFTVADQGKWTITDAKDDTPLFAYDVTTCAPGQGGQ
jgi:hypothetical protein